jgi:hypothetical protein
LPDTVRFAILDDAFHEVPLWQLPWGMEMITDGEKVQVHPPWSMDEVRPVLAGYFEGHV